MIDVEEEFDLAQHIDDAINMFKVIHVYNQTNVYHLMRQVLLDTGITQDAYCLFHQILTEDVDDFNDKYGSFACLIYRTEYEADLYLNVDSEALKYIINYIQTGKDNRKKLTINECIFQQEIVDLATMFGMPSLKKWFDELSVVELGDKTKKF